MCVCVCWLVGCNEEREGVKESPGARRWGRVRRRRPNWGAHCQKSHQQTAATTSTTINKRPSKVKNHLPFTKESCTTTPKKYKRRERKRGHWHCCQSQTKYVEKENLLKSPLGCCHKRRKWYEVRIRNFNFKLKVKLWYSTRAWEEENTCRCCCCIINKEKSETLSTPWTKSRRLEQSHFGLMSSKRHAATPPCDGRRRWRQWRQQLVLLFPSRASARKRKLLLRRPTLIVLMNFFLPTFITHSVASAHRLRVCRNKMPEELLDELILASLLNKTPLFFF